MLKYKCRLSHFAGSGPPGRAASSPQHRPSAAATSPLPSLGLLYVHGINPLYSGFVSGGQQQRFFPDEVQRRG